MTLVYSEQGGLLVAEQAEDAKSVRRQLKALDRDLMLTHDIDAHYGRAVWQVQHRLGSSVPPLLVFEWRDDSGCPRPLSSGLVEAFKRQEARGRELYAGVAARNEKRRRAIRETLDQEFEEAARELGRAGNDVHSACFHRGPHLRQARARRRGRGYPS